ncbi:hypothetical protein [Ectobacillus polymachus]|uniref:hypothetical protein n=1 Tax=Ectobacillus polymachus TaxID=1508806 RepID=UPI003A89E8AC
MQQNQLVGLICGLGVIAITLSHLIHTSGIASTIFFILGWGLVGFGIVKFFVIRKKGKE